jgi:maltose alpha-D-glucosyltransferase / alpha-amylase
MAGKKIMLYIGILLAAVLITIWLKKLRKPDTKIAIAGSSPAKELPWYKHAVFYTLDVKVFQDSDGDGTGDFSIRWM